ncbi:hypothetical protein C1922_13225 [Stenotrophomonas sp. ZAC14D2_NAIMI4_7]|uniref:hypothetical protein n=1 Tax=unclassified Stenotrophomonas maltophilia group TaxID=2961925 RepID=UPI000D5427D1|nr:MULTISPECIES: hypothetical protein [unclassified Stenotrophomonas maltophilia group]AWH18191.1 hypothetical protein C1922_13225 [Stenotrophomonas sp. ZAC14D2_NAIMI4_7]AWH25993.1 hypothetical protein C1932_13290 [Stenotrophomonas sp. YAU14D1_LEIMI4_1]
MDDSPTLPQLHRALRRLHWLVASLALLLVPMAATIAWLVMQGHTPMHIDELTTRRLQVLDDRGTVRVEISQDDMDDGRRSRSAGLLIFDATGAERGGIATFDDGAASLALDAPIGRGEAPVRDRIGLMVDAEGASQILLTDNQTRGVVRLRANGEGGGGVDLFKWDMGKGMLHTRTLTHDGEESSHAPFGK